MSSAPERPELRMLGDGLMGSYESYPKLVMGTYADGTPKVLAAEFKGSVRIADGQVYIDEERYSYDLTEAKERGEALQDAVRWVENDLCAAVEKYHGLKGGAMETEAVQGQGDVLSAAIDMVKGLDEVLDVEAGLGAIMTEDTPPPPEERWGVASNGHQVIWDPEMPQQRYSRNWCSTLDDSLRFDAFSAVELTGSARTVLIEATVDQVTEFLAPGVHGVEVNHDGPDSSLRIKVQLTKNQAIEFGEGAVIFRRDMSAEGQPDEYYLMTKPNKFGAMWKAAGRHEFSGAHLARVWHP